MSTEMDYQAMDERVEAGVKKEKNLAKFLLFVINLAMFVVFVVMAWQIHILNGGALPTMAEMINMPGVPKPTMNPMTNALLMMSVGWGIAIFMQAVSMIMDTSLGERSIRDRVTGREMRKEMARIRLEDKEASQKRKGMMRLTDDGELEAIDEVADEAVPNQQNRKG